MGETFSVALPGTFIGSWTRSRATRVPMALIWDADVAGVAYHITPKSCLLESFNEGKMALVSVRTTGRQQLPTT